MSTISRRELIGYFALAPTLPHFVARSGAAVSAQAGSQYDGPIVVVVRMKGGNDGLNTVIPVRDDRYFQARPTIAISKRECILTEGGDLGLNPWLVDFHRLIEQGHGAIVQGVGYANSSRSHSRSTEIWEAGTVDEHAPPQGWLGRYLDHECDCESESLAGVQFADELGLTLASAAGHSKSIAHPQLMLDIKLDALSSAMKRGPRASRLEYLRQVENDLATTSAQLDRATTGSGARFNYPDTEFGQSLRWAGDMIETGAPTRVYYATIGSFASLTAPSFDTHSDQLDRHRILFSDLGSGLRAFAAHLRDAGQLDRVLLLTFSDFGRQVEENRDGGTDHGDASVLFLMGGKIRPGLLGTPADLGNLRDGGLVPSIDFRQIYSSVLADWLKVDARTVLGEPFDPFRVLA